MFFEIKKLVGSIVYSMIFSIIFPIYTMFYIIWFNLYTLFNKKNISNFAQIWGKQCLFLLSYLTGLKVKYHHLPKNLSGAIITSQHQSALEIIALIAIIPNTIFVLKKELLYLPLFGNALKKLGMISVDRKKLNSNWILQAQTALEQGKNLIIFPEGTRVKFGAEVPYKKGAFKLAQLLNKKIIPVAVDTGLFWPRKSIIKTAGTANIVFGEAIDPEPELLRITCNNLIKQKSKS